MIDLVSEDLTRVGPGTVMGDFMRQYWIPAMKSSELTTGRAPLRLKLLGEKLIAFRDGVGRVGVMDHRCPHRCASLFLGRNENEGLRCIYHGWKFDVEGKCLETPSLPSENQDFKNNVVAKAYKTQERSGLIWVYMGAEKEPSPLPMIESTLAPESELKITFVQRNCNWMQALEGDIDTSHAGFLHYGGVNPESVPPGHYLEHMLAPRSAEFHVREAPWGVSSGAYRQVKAGPGEAMYWRFCNYMFPFWTQTPAGEFATNVHDRAWVPLDDEHTMLIMLRWHGTPSAMNAPLNEGKAITSREHDYEPDTTDWLGRWRLKADESNDWKIDRDAQLAGRSFSGIANIPLQDQAITESMGGVTSHEFEHLGPGDMMISRTRRCVLQAARAHRARQSAPPCVNDPSVYMGSRGGYFVADLSLDWVEAYEDQMQNASHPADSNEPTT